MAQSKSQAVVFKRQPAPTFSQRVAIPVPGDDVPFSIEFEFRTRSKAEVDALIAADRKFQEVAEEIVVGWQEADAGVAYSPDALVALQDAFPGAPLAIYRSFLEGLHQGRAKN